MIQSCESSESMIQVRRDNRIIWKDSLSDVIYRACEICEIADTIVIGGEEGREKAAKR